MRDERDGSYIVLLKHGTKTSDLCFDVKYMEGYGSPNNKSFNLFIDSREEDGPYFEVSQYKNSTVHPTEEIASWKSLKTVYSAWAREMQGVDWSRTKNQNWPLVFRDLYNF